MKILVYFLTLTIATIMVLYNHKAFIVVNKMVEQLDSVSTKLEQRGRQKYLLQKHFTVVKSSNDYSIQQLDDLKDSYVFDSGFGNSISKDDYPDIIDWPKVEQTQRYRSSLISQFPINYPSDIVKSPTFNLEDWTNRMVDTLDQIQQQDILLVSRLNNLMINQLAKVVTVNVVLVATMFLIVLFYNYKSNKENLAKKQKLNQSLVSREKALISSKKVLISLMEDLSQEKNAALKLFKMFKNVNEKLEAKNNDMEQFIYTVSHDLKAPLVTIGSFSQSLHQQLIESLNDKQVHKFKRIEQNVKEMQGLLADLLEISRVMTQEVEKSNINTKQLLDSLLIPLEELIAQSEAKISIKEPILDVYANPRLLGLCITNLVSNAVHHRDLDRTLEVEISTKMSTEGVMLSVKDNGVGIDEKEHDRIFKVFERLSQREGSGVGLAIVKAVIDKHDGIIQLDSTPGVGSTFSLIFPFVAS